MIDTSSAIAVSPAVSPRDERVGLLLIFLSALMWSFGGAIARFIDAGDSWTVVF
ncbi:MAG: EamA family transporter, partial [Mesorhizobium sp.]